MHFSILGEAPSFVFSIATRGGNFEIKIVGFVRKGRPKPFLLKEKNLLLPACSFFFPRKDKLACYSGGRPRLTIPLSVRDPKCSRKSGLSKQQARSLTPRSSCKIPSKEIAFLFFVRTNHRALNFRIGIAPFSCH